MTKPSRAERPLDGPRGLTRRDALAARPQRTAGAEIAPTPDGGLELRVRRSAGKPPGRIARLLGGGGARERTYLLDVCGREVFEACTGEASVAAIAAEFAARHGLARVEAELAVARYLRTLLEKGLVAMGVDAPGERR